MNDVYKFVWEYDFDNEDVAHLATMSILSQATLYVNLGQTIDDIAVDQDESIVKIGANDESVKEIVEKIFIPVFMEIMRENDD